jgi:hypothetical protein
MNIDDSFLPPSTAVLCAARLAAQGTSRGVVTDERNVNAFVVHRNRMSQRGTKHSSGREIGDGSGEHDDLDWIVPNGALTDGMLDTLREYWGRITCLASGLAGGIFDAMHKGVQIARGCYLLFLNGGNRLHDVGVVADMLPQFKESANLLVGDFIHEHPDGQMEMRRTSDEVNTAHRLYRVSLPHLATVIRTVFRYVGLSDVSYRIAGDDEWFVRAVVRTRGFVDALRRPVAVFNADSVRSRLKRSTVLSREIRRTHYPLGHGLRWVIKDVVCRAKTRRKCSFTAV